MKSSYGIYKMEETKPAPLPSIAVEIPKVPHGNKGKKVNETQLANLRKGMEALKAKREEVKKKKAEKKEKQKLGIPIDDSSEDEAPKPKKEGEVERPKPIIQYIPVKPRKERKDTGIPKPPRNYATRDDFENFKNSILETMRSTPMIKEIEKPVERIVDREVIKEVPVSKVLSGSEMLNKIFFNM